MAALTVGAVALALQAATGLLGAPDPGWRPAAVARVLIVPALTEELVFRGPLFRVRRHRGAAATALLAAYVAWHPLAAWLWRPTLWELFSAPGFLLLTAVLGAAATALVLICRNLWPAVALHGSMVALWVTGFGAP